MARPEKVETVKEIAGRFSEVDAALLTEYRGLSVPDIADVRRSLREAGAEYKVLKNTLARLAVREVGLEELVEHLIGPTAIVFVRGDAAAAAKALDEATKKYPVIVVKGGVLNGKVIDAAQAKALARLESRDVLLAKIAMLANSPLQQMVNVLAAPLRDLGSMLAQVVSKKESDELPGAAVEPVAEVPEGEPEPETPAVETESPAEPEQEEAERSEPEPATEDVAAEAAAEESAGEQGGGEAPAPDEAVEAAVEESAGEATPDDSQSEPADK